MYAVQPVTQQGREKQQSDEGLKNQALFQHLALMQQPMYHPGILSAMTQQLEPIPSGNLPPGFDATACRSVYVGNIHGKVTQSLLADLFSAVGPLEGCKLIKKEKSSYGFIDYYDHRCASAALIALNGKLIFGQPVKVNWAFASGQREDTTGHFNIFVGDLSLEVTDATLYAAFSIYPSCSDARVMWDQRSGRSRGFGFVSFRTQADADTAINDMNGKWLGSRQLRCNWATKNSLGQAGRTSGEAADPVAEEAPVAGQDNAAEATSSTSAEAQSPQNECAHPTSQYTTVYVGNLANEVTQSELHRQFYALELGTIEEVRVQRGKGFGFVRYSQHSEAAMAIQGANGRVICGKSVKCSWGNKPTPPAQSSSAGLPPPALAPAFPAPYHVSSGGFSAADILAYQRQMNFSQAAVARALMPMSQPAVALGLGSIVGLSPANIGMGQGMYDSFQPGALQGQISQQPIFF